MKKMDFSLLSKTIFLALVLYTASQAIAARLPETDYNDCKRISPSIIANLSDFTQLIDMLVIDSIVAEHYLFDAGFRTAFDYVKTSNFIQFLDELQNVPEVLDILSYLQILVSCSDLELDVPQLEIVLLEALEHEKNLRYQRQRRAIDLSTTSNVSTFTSFVAEVLHQLPRTRYANLIKTKCEKSSDFKTFYTGLRSPSFRPKVEAALKTANIAPYIKKLSSHRIDVNSLVPVLFELISWGPTI